jgi:hypothetical protein
MQKEGALMSMPQKLLTENPGRFREKLNADVKRNERGQVVLSSADEWFHEDEWDTLFEEVKRRDAKSAG